MIWYYRNKLELNWGGKSIRGQSEFGQIEKEICQNVYFRFESFIVFAQSPVWNPLILWGDLKTKVYPKRTSNVEEFDSS